MPASDCDGDRKDCDDINSWECYDESIYHDCCNTCADYTVQPVIPECEFGDRESSCDVNNGIRCYDNSVRNRCCATCQNYNTDIPGCRYGDKIHACESSRCHTYSNKRRDDCCSTCDPLSVTSSTVPPGTTSEWFTFTTSGYQPATNSTMNPSNSTQNGLPTWALPAAISVGGVIVLLLIIIIVVMVRRNQRKPDRLSPIDDKMYNEYKISKRAPMAPPRPLSTQKDWVLERKDSAEYAYINPADVEGPDDHIHRSGNDPLPPPPTAPAEYLDLSEEAKYCDVKAVESTDTERRRSNDNGMRRYNSYQSFPTNTTRTGNEYMQPQSDHSITDSRPSSNNQENGRVPQDRSTLERQSDRF